MQGTALSGTRPDDTPLHGLVASTGKSPIINSAFHKPMLPHQLASIEKRKPCPPKVRRPGHALPILRTLARVNSYHEIPTDSKTSKPVRQSAEPFPHVKNVDSGKYNWARARRYVQMSSVIGSTISQARRLRKQKNRKQRSEKPKKVNDGPRVVSRDGVSLGFLNHVVQWSMSLDYPRAMDDGREVHSYRELTCEDILDMHVLPDTHGDEQQESCSYTDFLQRNRSRFNDRPAAGRATAFVVYCRQYLFADFVAALSELHDKYFWIDMWSQDQHELIEDPIDAKWFASFETTVKEIAYTVAVFDKWDKPMPLSRLWCMYELAVASRCYVAFGIVLLPQGATELSQALPVQYKDLAQSVEANFSSACIEDDDERSLLIDALDHSTLVERQGEVQSMLQDWLADQGQKVLRSMSSESRATSELAEQLAHQLKQLGRLAEALPIMRQRLAGAKMKYGEGSKESFACMHALGELHHLRWLCKDGHNDLDLALPLLLEALEGRRERFGLHDINTLSTMDKLALVYHDLGQLGNAKDYSLEAVAGFSTVLDEGHPYLLTAKQNLGLILRRLGSFDEALPLHVDVYKGRQKTCGPDAAETIESASALGWLYVKRSELASAAEVLREAVAGNRALRGDSHPNTIIDVRRLHTVLNNLKSASMNDTGSYDLEIAELNRVMQQTSPEGTLSQLWSMASSSLDRREQELEMLETVYKDCRKAHGTHDPRTLQSLATIGWYHHVHRKNSSVAVNSLRQALVGLTNLVDENGVHHHLVPKVAKQLRISLERMAQEEAANDGGFKLDSAEMAILDDLTTTAREKGARKGRRRVWVAAQMSILLRTALTDAIENVREDRDGGQ